MADERDTFEFIKSTLPQGITKDKPMTSVNYNYVNDINQSIYTNSNLTLVQYDLTSLYNSSALMNTADMFLVIPTVTCAILTNGANPTGIVQSPNCFGLVTPKNFSSSIIHQVDFAVDGKTISQLQPYSNIMYGLDQASALSNDDIILSGRLKGASTQLDNPNSQIYTGRYGTGNGSVAYPQGQTPSTTINPLISMCNPSTPGLSNNVPFAPNSASGINYNGNATGSVGTSSQSQNGVQNAFTVNGCIQEKVSNSPNINGIAFNGAQNNIYGTIVTTNNIQQEFRPYSFYNQATNVMTWYDFLTIRLADILPAFNNIGLMRKFNAILRVYINTGLVTVACTPVSNNNLNRDWLQMTFGGTQFTSFTNTCPITINNLGRGINYQPTWLYNAPTFTDITVGFFIGSAPNYTLTTASAVPVNFSQLTPASPITSTRFYYSTNILDPLKMADYLASQQSKVVVNRSFLYNTYNNIPVGGSFSQLIQSGVKNISAVVIVPLISQAVNGFSQFQSPFDPCGGFSGAPMSLINLQCLVGGVQCLSSALTYSFEDYIEQVAIYNKSSSTEYGIESGLISKQFWDANRFYIINVRSTTDDLLTPRNVNINFINNNNVAIDIMVYVVYEDEWVFNCATGIVSQKY
jgi:hypothetical protein